MAERFFESFNGKLRDNFVIWVRMDQSNERPEEVYLIPVADFADHQYTWQSVRTLHRYEQYA